MKHKFVNKLLVLILAAVLVSIMPVTAFAADSMITVKIDATRYDAAAQEVLDLVNAQRSKYGLYPLSLDSGLQNAAMLRAAESVVYFSHTRPNGGGCWTVNPALIAGENLAVGQTSPQQVVDAWMKSDLHRANILNENYYSIGIGCINYNGTWYWSQCFGKSGGDKNTANTITEMQQDVSVMTSLVELAWTGETKLNLGSSKESAVQINGVNAGWGYGTYALDSSMLLFSSSNEDVLKIDEAGMMTPVSVGTASVTAALAADPDRAVTKEIQIVKELNADDVKLSKTSYTYDGKAKKPTVTVEGLTEDDYVVSYKNNVKVGNATVTVTGVGDVSGTVEKTFKIEHDRPGQVTLKSPTTGSSHYVKARWNDLDCDGYQIRYATNSDFKNSKSIYVKDGDTLSKTIKDLKKGKRYYVKVRAYNNYEDSKVFGKWSKWKSIVCK